MLWSREILRPSPHSGDGELGTLAANVDVGCSICIANTPCHGCRRCTIVGIPRPPHISTSVCQTHTFCRPISRRHKHIVRYSASGLSTGFFRCHFCSPRAASEVARRRFQPISIRWSLSSPPSLLALRIQPSTSHSFTIPSSRRSTRSTHGEPSANRHHHDASMAIAEGPSQPSTTGLASIQPRSQSHPG
jgi:hypothetical protein